MSINLEKEILKDFKDKEKTQIQISRENSGIIISSAFAMIILLLSLIEKRSLALDIGIFFLTFSIIMFFELIMYLSKWMMRHEYIRTIKKWDKSFKYQTTMIRFGLFFFYIGLLFVFTHFKLIIVIFPYCIFLSIKCYTRNAEIIRDRKEVETIKRNAMSKEELDKNLQIIERMDRMIRILNFISIIEIINSILTVLSIIFSLFLLSIP
jgi:hypothetical protein